MRSPWVRGTRATRRGTARRWWISRLHSTAWRRSCWLSPPGRSGDFLAAYASDVDGRLLIDATNNVGAAATNAAAAVAQAAPNARYVRAFNTLGWENFADPIFDGVAADLFFSAPEADRDIVERLISDVGLRPAYLGPDKQDLVDSVLPLWFTLAQLRGQRHLAFRILQD